MILKPSVFVLSIVLLFLLPVGLWGNDQTTSPFVKDNIEHTMTRVAGWQMKHFTYRKEGNLHDYGIDAWTNGVLYLGMLEWAKIADEPSSYFDWLMKIGTDNQWAVPANFANYPKYQYYHADEMCIGQFYLGMYDVYKEDAMLRAIRDRADSILAHPADTSMNHRNKQIWTWCDALFMAPPVYASLFRITGKQEYLQYMHQNFLRTYRHLYDKENCLYFRDDSYFGKREANGKKIFWGRGNGWVIAGIANILGSLPADCALRPFYEKQFVELAARLSQLQDKDGFWHASLLDPDSYPSPETSSTALITYGLAYGLNHHLLDNSYLSVVKKGWEALTSTVNEDGKVGWVQPIGADPKKVTGEMTAVYGVGAFLLAGTEIMKMKEITPRPPKGGDPHSL